MKKFYVLSIVAIFFTQFAFSGAPENLLKNGGFEDGVKEPWTVYGKATHEVVKKIKSNVKEDPAENKHALHVVVAEKGGNFWDSGLQHKDHVFDKGKKYTLAAFLKSDDNLEINFKPELGQDPWTGYGAKRFVMTEKWQEFHTTTPPMPNDVVPATITFHIAFDKGEFWIDGVRWFEGDYVPADGEPKAVQPADKLATLWSKIRSE